VPKWTKALLKDTVFEKEKVLALLKNLTGGAASLKREGYRMASTLLRSLDTVKGFCLYLN
jgi:hypothetical protein